MRQRQARPAQQRTCQDAIFLALDREASPLSPTQKFPHLVQLLEKFRERSRHATTGPTTPVMHDPPHNARTGTDRPRNHAVRRRTPHRDFLHDPQDSFNELLPHSSIILSTAQSTSRGSIGTTARSVSAIGPGSSPSSPDDIGFTILPSPPVAAPGSATTPPPLLRAPCSPGRPRPRRGACTSSVSPACGKAAPSAAEGRPPRVGGAPGRTRRPPGT